MFVNVRFHLGFLSDYFILPCCSKQMEKIRKILFLALRFVTTEENVCLFGEQRIPKQNLKACRWIDLVAVLNRRGENLDLNKQLLVKCAQQESVRIDGMFGECLSLISFA